MNPEPQNLESLRSCDIVLASSSPRRRELLEELGLTFRIEEPSTDEMIRSGEAPERFAVRAAQEKADNVWGRLRGQPLGKDLLIVAADTIVVFGRHVLGKPSGEEEAKAMLRMLSGNTHEVISGVCLLCVEAADECVVETSFMVKTTVVFKDLSEDDIVHYVASGEPMDKAGSYAIQGGAQHMVAKIEGSYANVVGLPVDELVDRAEALLDS